MRNFKQLKNEVEKVLSKYDKAKNNDKWLTYKVWSDMYPSKIGFIDGKKGASFETMLILPDEQTITRIRRKYNQMGLYLATDLTVLKRREKERKIKQEIKEF